MPVTKNRLYLLILCSLFAALCAIGAFIKVPLAWLPITLQTFFSTLAGLLASLAGAVILYVVGLPYFYGIMTLYLQQAMTVSQLFAVYCLPTLPGDVIKCIVCASVVGRLRTALSQKLPV